MKNLSIIFCLTLFSYSCTNEVSESFKSSITQSEKDLTNLVSTANDLSDKLKSESTKWNTMLADMKFEMEDKSVKPNLTDQADSLVQICALRSANFGSLSGQVNELIVSLNGTKSALDKLKLDVTESKIREDIATGKLQEINNQIFKTTTSITEIVNQVSETKSVCENAAQAFNVIYPSE